jgi:hypothetical protein
MKKIYTLPNIIIFSFLLTSCFDVNYNNPNDPLFFGTSVTYNSNGATSGEVPVDNTNYRAGQTVIVLGNTGNLVKTGYSLIGWNTSASGLGTTYTTGQTFNFDGNVTLYAQWIGTTVTYNLNGATSGIVPVDSTIYTIGQTATVLGNTGNLMKTGCTFAGWNTSPFGWGTTYTQWQTFIFNDNVTLYALWVDSGSVFTVTYDSNNAISGIVPIDSILYKWGETATVLGNTGNLTYIAGYFFAGWNTVADGSGTAYIQGQKFQLTTNNVILYAQWAINPKRVDILNFPIIDAEYSKSLDLIVMISSGPNQLNIYNIASGQINSVSLSITPLCVSVSPDGKYAAVGGNNTMEYVDLQTATSLKIITPTNAPAGDIVLAGNGYAYIFPSSDQWTTIKCINISSGTIINGTSIYSGTIAKLNPVYITTIYAGDEQVSPAHIRSYDISSGTAIYDHDCPYHGDYEMGGTFWISEEGNRIYSSNGTTFTCSTVQSQDLIFSGYIGYTAYTWINESSTTQQFVCIPLGPSKDEYIEYYQSSNLIFVSRTHLPMYNVGNNWYPGHGQFAFYSSDGSTVSVIVKADGSSGLINNYEIVQY